MPITAIIEQPAASALKSAYNPIKFRVTANNGVSSILPVVHCDIYINSIFYRTISKTQYASDDGTNTEWVFDIQDPCQERLKKQLGTLDGSSVIIAEDLFLNISCKFRSSIKNADGFIQSEQLEPIQATGSTEAVSGAGTQSNSFYVVAVALQHDEIQDLEDHLDLYKNGTWDPDCYPMSHRPSGYSICIEDSDYFPFFNKNSSVDCIRLNYRYNGVSGYVTLNSCGMAGPCNALALLGTASIPDGSVGNPYTYSFSFSGDGPFDLGAVTKPTWMTVALDGNEVTLSGTPDATGTSIPVSIEVTNCSAANSVTVNQTIDVTECVAVSIDTFDLPNATAGVAYSYNINLLGDGPFAFVSLTKPTWMNVFINGSVIELTGTPTVVATGETLSFEVSNCEGSNTDTATDTLDVIEGGARWGITDNISGNSLNGVWDMHLLGPEGLEVEIKVIQHVNTNGGVIQVDGVQYFLNQTFLRTIPVGGDEIITVEIFGVTNPGSSILQRYEIQATTASPSIQQISKAFL